MSNPTCPQCDCVAGCRDNPALCPNVEKPTVAAPVPSAAQEPRTEAEIVALAYTLSSCKYCPERSGEVAFKYDQLQAFASAIAQPVQPATLDGCVWVPIEPTQAMLDAGSSELDDTIEIYRAMIEAAPVGVTAQPFSKSVNGWREISTLELSDDLVWLRNEISVDGPLVADTDSYDSYTHWAFVKSPPINIAQPTQPVTPDGCVWVPIEPTQAMLERGAAAWIADVQNTLDNMDQFGPEHPALSNYKAAYTAMTQPPVIVKGEVK